MTCLIKPSRGKPISNLEHSFVFGPTSCQSLDSTGNCRSWGRSFMNMGGNGAGAQSKNIKSYKIKVVITNIFSTRTLLKQDSCKHLLVKLSAQLC